jgi:hypothetical protein
MTNKNKSTIAKIYRVIGCVIAFGIMSNDAMAQAEDANDPIATWSQYCLSTGGKVVDLNAKFSTLSGDVDGLSKAFCQYQTDGNIEMIGLDTLASTSPSLGATYAKSLTLDPSRPLPEKPYANPSLNVCERLKGSSIAFYVCSGGFSNESGEYDICVFGDGSSISAWTLIYLANGDYPQIKALIKAQPMDITIPII